MKWVKPEGTVQVMRGYVGDIIFFIDINGKFIGLELIRSCPPAAMELKKGETYDLAIPN